MLIAAEPAHAPDEALNDKLARYERLLVAGTVDPHHAVELARAWLDTTGFDDDQPDTLDDRLACELARVVIALLRR